MLCMGGCLLMLMAAAENGAGDAFVPAAIETVAPGVWRLRFGVPEAFTPERFRERPPALDRFDALPEPEKPPFSLDDIRCRVAASRTVVYVPCHEPADEIYGFGLDPACYRQKGLRKRLTVSASKIGETGASHGPVPFYLSIKATVSTWTRRESPWSMSPACPPSWPPCAGKLAMAIPAAHWQPQHGR